MVTPDDFADGIAQPPTKEKAVEVIKELAILFQVDPFKYGGGYAIEILTPHLEKDETLFPSLRAENSAIAIYVEPNALNVKIFVYVPKWNSDTNKYHELQIIPPPHSPFPITVKSAFEALLKMDGKTVQLFEEQRKIIEKWLEENK